MYEDLVRVKPTKTVTTKLFLCAETLGTGNIVNSQVHIYQGQDQEFQISTLPGPKCWAGCVVHFYFK
jgi:hypothetical protein